MPKFFDPNNLTPAQRESWGAAVVEYGRIQQTNRERLLLTLTASDREAYALLNPVPKASTRFVKSALFGRLLEGKQALPFPPPCSFSYPWYSVIEDEGPWDVQVPDEAHKLQDLYLRNFLGNMADTLVGTAPKVLLNQSAWTLLRKNSETSGIVSFGEWASAGWTWELKREALSTTEAPGFICAWHNPKLGRITTLEQLRQEQRWHVAKRLQQLEYALNPELAEQYIQTEKVNSFFRGAAAESAVAAAHIRLNARRQQGIPDLPDAHENEDQAMSQVGRYLNRGYFADDQGALFVWVWRLHRLSRGPASPQSLVA